MRRLDALDQCILEKYPDPHIYKNVWQRALWVLHVVSLELDIDRLSCSEIAYFLTHVLEIDTSPQAVRYAMKSMERGLVNAADSSYKIMEKGRGKIIQQKQTAPIGEYFEAGKPLSSKIIFSSKIISNLSGEIRICDPYLGARLMDVLLSINKKNKIKILGTQIEDKPMGIFSRTLADLKNEGFQIEVRQYSKGELHDRYVIDDKNMWILGYSIKDLGKKESFVVRVGPDLRSSALESFNRRWKISTPVS